MAAQNNHSGANTDIFWALERFFPFLWDFGMAFWVLAYFHHWFHCSGHCQKVTNFIRQNYYRQFDVFNYPSAVKTAQSANKLEYSDSNNPNTL